jgi:hypothetical protein
LAIFKTISIFRTLRKPLLRRGLGRPVKRNPPFGGGSLYIVCLFYTYAPPPFEEDIIMTTTIIILATREITLYTLFFNIKSVCIANIHPPSEKKSFGKQIILKPEV